MGNKRAESDEYYVLDLCDEILGQKAQRQHRFDWLRGDVSPKTKRSVRLPVDGFWPELSLVIEYRERQHNQPVPFFDKPDEVTISGVSRGEQRRLYDARRDLLIPRHQISLLIITPAPLAHTRQGRLLRKPAHDRPAIRKLLQQAVDC